LKRRLHELPRDRKIVLYCQSGAAAAKAKQLLDARGFNTFNGGGYKDVLKIVRVTASTRAAPAGRSE
jgi:rhodanese-related sulfurtransferase